MKSISWRTYIFLSIWLIKYRVLQGLSELVVSLIKLTVKINFPILFSFRGEIPSNNLSRKRLILDVCNAYKINFFKKVSEKYKNFII